MPQILIVDDDRELCTMLAEFLLQHGFGADVQFDGEPGLERALAGGFDLLILDVMLPALDGFETLQQLRQRSRLPVLMLTARGDRSDRIRGLELGADDYLSKPFDPEELLARVRAILRRSGPQPSLAPLELGELRLLPGAREVYFAGKRLEVTAMECEILEFLMRSCGHVVSRDQLIIHLYQREATAFDRSIDTHISRIRRKLGEGRNMIRSIRGTGYLLRYPVRPEDV
jgi:two-component system response regulator CpxR